MSFYFSGIKTDSSAPVSHRDITETYTVSTVFCCGRWETCIFDDEKAISEIVWTGDDRSDAKEMHKKFSKMVRAGQFYFSMNSKKG